MSKKNKKTRIESVSADSSLEVNFFDSLDISNLELKENKPKPNTSTTPKQADKKQPRTVVKLRLEKTGRSGKEVTVLEGIATHDSEKILLLLKRKLGVGGAIKENNLLEIQGDKRPEIRALLSEFHYIIKG